MMGSSVTPATCDGMSTGVDPPADLVLDPLFGKHRVLDHWDNALVTGRLAGRVRHHIEMDRLLVIFRARAHR